MAGNDDSNTNSDDEWAESIGLPKATDTFIEQYFSSRSALIDQERSSRSDAAFRASLTPLANEACAIVAKIREEEHRTVWNRQGISLESDDELDDEDDGAEKFTLNFFPGMMFGLAREQMEETKLWRIVRKMPKGALLHAHFDAMIDIPWLVNTTIDTEGMGFAMCPLPGTEGTPEGNVPRVPRFQYKGDLGLSDEQVRVLWNDTYEAGQFLPAKLVAEQFWTGGRESFVEYVVGQSSISKEESLNQHLGLDDIWRKFKSCFGVVNSMLLYEPIFRASVQRVLEDLLEDGIRWVDFRCVFWPNYRRQGCIQAEHNAEALFEAFGQELERFKTSEKGKGFWGARFIWTALRIADTRGIVHSMQECITVKKRFPDLISGFDLVGQEDAGRPLADLVPELFWFQKACLEARVDIPFFFHAGECLGDGDETDDNLYDAIVLGTRRIGHGFSLYKHPLLIETVKQKAILIESCPISNEILRLTGNIKSHPLPALLARGVRCSLSNDDPAMLGHGKIGLSHDFWQCLQGWENLGLAGLGSLAENSVRYAAYGPDQSAKEWTKDVRDGVYGQGARAERMRQWVTEWNKFCEWIVMEYAVEYGTADDEEGQP